MLRLGLILSTVLTATTITATNINNLVNQCTYIFPHKCNNNKKKTKRERVCVCVGRRRDMKRNLNIRSRRPATLHETKQFLATQKKKTKMEGQPVRQMETQQHEFTKLPSSPPLPQTAPFSQIDISFASVQM